MIEYATAKQRFDALPIPDSCRLSTGPDESAEIARLTNEYFDSVVEALQLSRRALEAFFVIEHGVIGREDTNGRVQVTDDFDASLWLEGVQPLASVRNVRDDRNWQVILFAKYSLVQPAESLLRQIYRAS